MPIQAHYKTYYRALGERLATLDNVMVVTGGFYGVGETVGLSCEAARKAQGKDTNVWHILPETDQQVGIFLLF